MKKVTAARGDYFVYPPRQKGIQRIFEVWDIQLIFTGRVFNNIYIYIYIYIWKSKSISRYLVFKQIYITIGIF